MIEAIEARVKADLESEWPEAQFVDRRANVGFSDAKTTSHTFRIRTDEKKYALVIGPLAVRKADADAVIQALEEGGWVEKLKEEGRLLVELKNGEYTLGPRPDSIVL